MPSFPWTPAAAFVLAAAVFANSLHGRFCIDDGSAIRTNADLRPETPVSQLLVNDFWGRPLAEPTSVKSYRPLTVLTFRANFALHGLDVLGYHLGNVLLHALCSAAVGLLCSRLLTPSNPVAARVAALAFAVHPVHTEAVASIVGRAELLCCLFYSLCLLCHAAACGLDGGGGGHPLPEQQRGRLRSGTWFVAAGVFAILATASKETGITAPVAAALLDVLGSLPRSSPPERRQQCALRCAALAALTASLLAGSIRLRGAHLSPHFSFVDNPLPSLPSRASRLMSALHVHVRYARLLLWPAILSADYSYDCVPAVTSMLDARNVASAALYLALLWIGVASVRATRALAAAPAPRPTEPSASLASAARALVVLLAPMVPASHLLLGIGTLVAERLLYTPSVGYCALLGLAASAALRVAERVRPPASAARRAARLGVLAALGCGGALASTRTWMRNRDWAGPDAITRATARACPGSAKAQVSLGTMHLQQSDHALARLAFRAALRIHPQYPDALYWLGRLAFMESRPAEAEPLLVAALDFNAGHPEALLFAALCAARREDDARALELLGRAHDLAPHNAEIVRDYGAMLLRTGDPHAALPTLQRAVRMLAQLHELGEGTAHSRGSLASAQVKLAAVHVTLNRHEECVDAVRAAKGLEPSIGDAVGGLLQLCKRARREDLDTSSVRIDLAL